MAPSSGFRRVLAPVRQLTIADCGAACLCMVLRYHGRHVRLDEVREATGSGRGGVDADSLVRAAERYGFRVRAVKFAEVEELAFLDRATILHWRFNHFVVLDRWVGKGAWIVDPAIGRRFVSREQLDRDLTGVALLCDPGEEFERAQGPKWKIQRYLRPLLAHRGLLFHVLSTSAVTQILALSVPVLIGLLVDRVVPRGNASLLAALAAGLLGLVSFQFIAFYLRARHLLHLRIRIDSQMMADFLGHLTALPYRFFQERSWGDLFVRLNSNTVVRELLTSTVLSTFLDGLMAVFYLALLLTAHLRLGLLVAALAAVRIGLLLLVRRRHRQIMSEVLQAQSESRSFQIQILAGIESLKVMGAERRAVERWSHLFARELNAELRRGRLDAAVSSTLDMLATASPLAVLLYGGSLVLAGEISLGTMLALSALAQGFLVPLSNLVAMSFRLQILGSFLERIEDVVSTPREKSTEGRRLSHLRVPVVVDDVSFRYSTDGEPALSRVSLEIPEGSFVAIVGRSGSGKTTLAALLAGLHLPSEGRITFGGVALTDLDLSWLRSRLGFVPQSPFLFGTTIRSNIALNNPSLPFSRVVEAAQLAAVHEEIITMPMGYETPLPAGGAALSGGQKQRIAIARALVSRPDLVILDEATSALDGYSERRIQENLTRLDRTCIVIAHRLSTVRDADVIFVLDRGRLVQQGRHEDLIRRDGHYRDLIAAQRGAVAASSKVAIP